MTSRLLFALVDAAAMGIVALIYWLTQSIPLAAALTGLVSGASWWVLDRWGEETDD